MNDYSNFIGKILDKRYKILGLVGIGGMACVLRAQDLVMNRVVAIKILNDEYNGNEQAENRFIDESKAVAMLSHKNIVNIYDVAIYPDMKYIVMEYLDGITLREYLDNKGALPWNEACIYILQVLRALEHAHSKGVIHRDIKPQNIILQKNGEIKVMDFGIAKIPTSASISGDKAVGTVYYISPEQASGKETGAYSDLYSVGILLFEAVTGTLPFKADSPMAVAAMQVNDEPPNPRDLVLAIPVGVSQIILKAMTKDTAGRFRSAHSMSKAIEWVLRNPEVIFSLSGENGSAIGDTSVVSIDMIDTAEIKPYGDDEMIHSLDKVTASDKELEQKKKLLEEEKKQQKAKLKEKKKKKKRKKKRRTHSVTVFPIIAGIFFPFLLVALILAIFLGVTFVKSLFFAEDNTVTAVFPNLIGKEYDSELISRLQNGSYGATFEIAPGAVSYSFNPGFANGEIISTEPASNTTKKAENTDGKPVFYFTSIVVNRIQTTKTMPDVIGFLRADAKVRLTNQYGIDGSSIEFAEETDPKYNVLFDNQITRSYPAPGEPYNPGDTIILYVCTREDSRNTAPMPNCLGLDADYAKKLCEYALYKVKIVESPTPDGDNTVIAQSITKDKVSGRDTEVTLTVNTKLQGMPNFYLESLVDTMAYLDSAGIPYTYVIYEGVVDEDVIVGFRDLMDLLVRLESCGAYPSTRIDENTLVVFQSIPMGGEIPTEGALQLVCLNYEAF
ncbi:MAG: protein kinase [Clostridia bacterium]|nr:protein kinase [Clostridia bacterium]